MNGNFLQTPPKLHETLIWGFFTKRPQTKLFQNFKFRENPCRSSSFHEDYEKKLGKTKVSTIFKHKTLSSNLGFPTQISFYQTLIGHQNLPKNTQNQRGSSHNHPKQGTRGSKLKPKILGFLDLQLPNPNPSFQTTISTLKDDSKAIHK